MNALKANKHFAGLIAAELQALERTARMRTYEAGQTIFQEGDSGEGLFLVNDGFVQISALLGHGERKLLARVGPGDFFGEMAVLDKAPRSACATAENRTTVYFIPSEDLVAILERSPKVAVSLLRELSRRMRDFDRHYVDELLQAERLSMLGRFTRSILHDFKSPLAVIGMSAEIGLAADATPESRETANDRIRKQVERLSNMINELLEFSRGKAAAMVLAMTNYAEFLDGLIKDLQVELEGRGVRIELPQPIPAVSLPFDPRRLAHLIYNLVHNAVEAMPEGGRIFIRAARKDHELVTEIEDTGKGIAAEIADRLFQPFATYGKAAGTGLGLSICRKIIEDHHGQIRAANKPGHGAVFTFTLPLQQP